MIEPRLTQIVNGWAAQGRGWAVHGATKEEAILRFQEAEKKHEEVDALPYTFDKTLLDLQDQKQLDKAA